MGFEAESPLRGWFGFFLLDFHGLTIGTRLRTYRDIPFVRLT